MNWKKIPLGAWLLACVLVAAVAGVTIDVTDDGHVIVTKTRTVQAPPQVVVTDAGTQLSPAEAKEDANRDTTDVGLGLHEDLKDETPPGVTPEELAEGREQTEAMAEKTLVAPELPAGAQNYECSFHPVVNQSALTHKVIGVALHFTVSDPGSLPAIQRMFNTPSFGASSTYGFEPLTNVCWQFVPLDRKAWAQLSANSYYWSIEIVTKDRTRAQWLATPMIAQGKLAALVSDLLKRAGAPPMLVDPKDCAFIPGVVDHSRLECGNTHWDVGPGFPWDVFMRQVRQHYYGGDYKPACGKVCKRSRELRGKHLRTHRRFVRIGCKAKLGSPDAHAGYCVRLRNRNRAVHAAVVEWNRRHVKAENKISLKGTYR